MSEDDLRFWIERGKSTTLATETISYNLTGDIVLLWNIIGELGQRVLDLEATVDEFGRTYE